MPRHRRRKSRKMRRCKRMQKKVGTVWALYSFSHGQSKKRKGKMYNILSKIDSERAKRDKLINISPRVVCRQEKRNFEKRTCARDGCNNEAKKKCKCEKVKYCSTDCQKKHWNNVHWATHRLYVNKILFYLFC